MLHDRDPVIVSGVRTPFARAGTVLARVGAVELARAAVREAVERSEIDPDALDEVVIGNVCGPANAPNMARVVSLLAKVPARVPAMTVGRNCASGIEAVTTAASRIRAGEAELVIAAGVESMSTFPLLFSDEAREAMAPVLRRKSRLRRLAAAARVRPRHLWPVPALALGLRDPVSGLSMGESADRLSRAFGVVREEQDAWASRSHRLAAAAWSAGRMDREVAPFPVPPDFESAIFRDNGIRENTEHSALAKLPPAFDGRFGTVTAGNSCQISDGAVALVLASRARARALGLPIVGWLRAWAATGCDPARMGLGPVFAAPAALRRAGGLSLDRMDLVEIHEAFAAQVLACRRALESRAFCEEHLGSGPVGSLDPERLNVNGGAIAIGHPLGASGARLVLTLALEMDRRGASLGLAATCVGGGQGAAVVLERA